MKTTQAVRSWSWMLVILLAAWWGSSADALAQKTIAKPAGADPTPVSPAPAPNNAKLSVEQELALALLRQLTSDLKAEADKPSAALIQAQAADVLWNFDEMEARSLFRVAFDTANQPIPETSTIDKDEKARRLKSIRQQASVVQNILTLFGRHDHAGAEALLESLKDKRSTKPDAQGQLSQDRAEFLAQLALQEVRTNPDEAQKLVLFSLNAPEIPAATGQVLIALRSVDRAKGDVLFEAILAALRRNVYSAGTILTYLSNYMFFSNGTLFDRADAPHAAMLIDYLVDASNAELARWQELKASNSSMPDSAAVLLNFLGSRGLNIFRANAPDKLYRVQPVLNELSAALNQEQRANLAQLTAAQPPSTASDSPNDIDAALQKAESEKDPGVRDDLRRAIAVRTMRDNPEQALSIASRIDDPALRSQTEDDINLVLAAHIPRGAYVEARRAFAKFHDQNLRAKCLAELASRTYSISHNRDEAVQLFSEAYEIALKADRTADRADVLLLLAEKINSLDPARSFEFLSAAVQAVNQAKEDSASASPPAGRGLKIMTSTVVGGLELTAGKHATLDSLSFTGLASLLGSDYYRARNLGDTIQNKIIRGKYLLALARSVLDPQDKKPLTQQSL